MSKHKIANRQILHYGGKIVAATLGIALFAGGPLAVAPLYAAGQTNVDAVKAEPVKKQMPAKVKAKARKPAAASTKLARTIIPASTELINMELALGQSHLIRLPAGMSLKKVKVDDEKVVQVEVTSPRELVLHGKSAGSTSVMIWDKSGQATVVNVSVTGATMGMDAVALQKKLQQMLPNERGITVGTAGGSLVLTGTVADAVKVDKAMALADAYAGKENKAINMLQVAAPQQVMLEVKMAEVSKNLLDKLGAQFNASRVNGGVAYAIASGFLSLTGADPLSPGGLLTVHHGNTNIKLDAENKDGIVKILAEPNIIAISGQEGSFLAGGKLFIPVPQTSTGGASTITLEEREFGVGLKFTPTVLEGDLINLRVAPEVSELSSAGVSVGGSVFPSFTTRRVSTTVQLHDGQSFAIAGLIKNNVTETIRRFPVLGNIPILGALFRSSEFQNEKTELIFVVTPRLVKPLPPNYALPTDKFNAPSSSEFFLNGNLEGKPATQSDKVPAPQPSAVSPSTVSPAQKNSNDGFEMK